jgi:hypothetical protein
VERRGYRNVGDALSRIAKEEGYGALYKGLAPNIGRGMTMNMGMMACSDQAKEMMLTVTKVSGVCPRVGTREIMWEGKRERGDIIAYLCTLCLSMYVARASSPLAD